METQVQNQQVPVGKTQPTPVTKKRILFIILGVVIITLSGIFAVIFLNSQTENQSPSQNQTASPTVAPSKTTFSVSPVTQEVTVGQTFQAEINVSSQKSILASDLYLTFNPEYIEVVEINSGDVFKDPMILMEEIDSQTGSVIFSQASLSPSKKSGTIATVTVRAIAQGTTSLIIGENTLVSVKGAEEAETVVSSKNTITIN